jgi:hypothetical protein
MSGNLNEIVCSVHEFGFSTVLRGRDFGRPTTVKGMIFHKMKILSFFYQRHMYTLLLEGYIDI